VRWIQVINKRAIVPAILAAAVLAIVACNDDSATSSTDANRLAFPGTGDYQGEYWPTQQWRACRPEAVGIDSDRLLAVYDYAASSRFHTEALLVTRKGYIIGETYLNGFEQDERHYSYSVAKSFTGTVVGIAIDEGQIPGVEQTVYQYFPQWQQAGTDPRKQLITVRHLLTMTSGITWNEDDYYEDPSENDAYEMHRQPDLIQYVLDKTMSYTPGEHWYYSTGSSQLLSGVIEGATGMSLYAYARPRLLEPLGIENIIWDHDDAGHTHSGAGIHATAREYAKFGYLWLERGHWDTLQIVSEDWILESTKPVSESVTHYGYQWWRKPTLSWSDASMIPDSTIIAWGIYTQQIFVIPEEQIVIVRLGNDIPATNGWDEFRFLALVMAALQ